MQYLAEQFQRRYRISPLAVEADYQALKEKALTAKYRLERPTEGAGHLRLPRGAP